MSARGVTGATASPRYDPVAQALHWLTFALLAVSIPIAILLANVEFRDALKYALYDVHQSIGLTVGALTLARLAWRWRNPPPPRPSSLPPGLVLGERIVHAALYALLLIMPMLGWLADSALGFAPNYWWLVELPPLLEKNNPLGLWLLGFHKWLGFALLALLALHVGAALWHHFVRRDGTLGRMLPAPRDG